MKNIISLISTLSLLLLITTLSVLYSEGWRLQFASDKQSSDRNTSSTPLIVKTGMLAVRSIPDGAKVYIDEKLITATNDTISSLSPKQYNLRVEKDGFETWEKTINVYPELVTDITAVLVSQSPRLEPLTSNEVKSFALSSDYNNVAYITTNIKDPGIWTLPLSGGPLNILRNSSRPLIKDSNIYTPSIGTNITWSWNRKEILVELNPKGFLLYNIDTSFLSPNINGLNIIPIQLSEKETTLKRWKDSFKSEFEKPKIEEIFSEQKMPEEINQFIENANLKWSPDESKFIIEIPNKQNTQNIDVYVYNSEKNLPVDEKRLNLTLRDIDPKSLVYSWYSDSYHLILLKNTESRPTDYTVSLIRIDGTNQTAIYTGYLASNQAYTTPYGDKVIVMTSLKEGSEPNLYGIAIR